MIQGWDGREDSRRGAKKKTYQIITLLDARDENVHTVRLGGNNLSVETVL
jgi:hypothetical protein